MGAPEADEEAIYGEYLKNTTGGLLVMASVVATFTCQIAVSPPGGFWQDSTSPSPDGPPNSNTTAAQHVAGNAILYDRNHKEYTIFVILNTQVFLASICLIVVLLRPISARRNATKWSWVRGLTSYLACTIIILFSFATKFSTSKHIYNNYLFLFGGASWLFVIGFMAVWPAWT